MTIDVECVDDDIAHVYADTQQDMRVMCSRSVVGADAMLDVHGGSRGVWHQIKLEQQPVAEALDQPASACAQDLGLDLLHEASPAANDIEFVRLHETHGLDHVDNHHGLSRSAEFRGLPEHRRHLRRQIARCLGRCHHYRPGRFPRWFTNGRSPPATEITDRLRASKEFTDVAQLVSLDPEGVHWLVKALDGPLPHVFNRRRQPLTNSRLHSVGNHDATGLRQGLQTSGDVDPISVYRTVHTFNDISEVDPDPESEPAFLKSVGHRLCKLKLNVDGCRRSSNRAIEHGEHGITRRIDHAPPVESDDPAKHNAGLLKRTMRRVLVLVHQPRIADGIRSQYDRQPAPNTVVHAKPPRLALSHVLRKASTPQMRPTSFSARERSGASSVDVLATRDDEYHYAATETGPWRAQLMAVMDSYP